MNIDGRQLIRGSFHAAGTSIFDSIHADTGKPLGHTFYEATTDEVDQAAKAAAEAFMKLRTVDHKIRAAFLKSIAAEIALLGDEFIEMAAQETGLGIERLKGERARTMNQLNAFASFIEDGKWVRAIIDRADPERKPLPKPDLRQMQIPLGPVAVFGASNFPFAFSVAGGDTASALASGCPVIFKAHPAHPVTCEMAAIAIIKAIEKSGLPTGTFSLVHGRSNDVGSTLVMHPLVKAVAFTGSFRGGKALFDLAVRRPDPIPVYAEMGSVNPVIILSSAIKDKSDAAARQLAASITVGSGQFCTNPGLLLLRDEPDTHTFLAKVANELKAVPSATMLTSTIAESYLRGIAAQRKTAGVTSLSDEPGEQPNSHLLKINASDALKNPSIMEEVFGPSSVAIISRNIQELVSFCEKLDGQLTATILGEPAELEQALPIIQVLREKVGRVIINGYPTGVEVSPAMVHGGPFPATTDSRSTSVGTSAIYRFTRPVCYQNFPQTLLPSELRD